MAPDRTQLQNMIKWEHKSFKEYAQRWRDLAAQVALPMVEREIISMIVDTLLVLYYEKLVGYMPSSFVDLVFTGERIKVGLKRKKFDYVSHASTSNRRTGAVGAKRKEGDAHAVTSAPAWPKPQQALHGTHQYAQHHPRLSARAESSSSSAPIQPRTSAPSQRAPAQTSALTQPCPANNANPSMNSNMGRNPSVKQLPEFAPIPMSYGDLLLLLISNQLAVVTPGRIY